jgi:hypothetical protein
LRSAPRRTTFLAFSYRLPASPRRTGDGDAPRTGYRVPPAAGRARSGGGCRMPGRQVTALSLPAAGPVPGLDRFPPARRAGPRGPAQSPDPAAAVPAPGRSAVFGGKRAHSVRMLADVVRRPRAVMPGVAARPRSVHDSEPPKSSSSWAAMRTAPPPQAAPPIRNRALADAGSMYAGQGSKSARRHVAASANSDGMDLPMPGP